MRIIYHQSISMGIFKFDIRNSVVRMLLLSCTSSNNKQSIFLKLERDCHLVSNCISWRHRWIKWSYKILLHLLYIYDYNYIRWQMYSKYIMIRDMYIFVGKYTNVEYLFVLNKTRTYIYNYLTLINHQFSPKDFFF